MKIHVVVNPAGASGTTGWRWDRLEPLFRDRAELVVHYSTREKGIGELCHEIEEAFAAERRLKQVEENTDASQAVGSAASADDTNRVNIVIVGGDGSFNEAINGIENPDLVNFGFLSCGSGNDLARDMEWPEDLRKLSETILEGKVLHRLDIGEAEYPDTGEKRRFNMGCGIGFDAAICAYANSSPIKNLLNKLGLGKLIYIISAFIVIGEQPNLPFEVVVDGEHHKYDHMLFAVVMNRRYEGGGYKFAPDADTTDGILNLCIAYPKHNSAFYLVFPSVKAGTHFQKYRFMKEFYGREIEIMTSMPFHVQTDGEVKRKTDHIIVRVLDKKLNLLA